MDGARLTGLLVALDVTEPSSCTSLTTPMTSHNSSFWQSPSSPMPLKLYLTCGTLSSSHCHSAQPDWSLQYQRETRRLTGSISVEFSNMISYSLLTLLNCFLAMLTRARETKYTLTLSDPNRRARNRQTARSPCLLGEARRTCPRRR
jgi:hypothetical protein